MSETTRQAIYELLLGVNKELTSLREHLTMVVAQLQDQKTAEGSPRLGMCPECLQDWLMAGRPQQPQPRPALAWIAHPVGVAMPVCLPHFETLLKSLKGSQLILPGR
jgi:hypothetical protein